MTISPGACDVGEGVRAPGKYENVPACAGKVVNPDDKRLWDYDAGEDANNYAKAICRTCPVQEWCLATAVRDKLDGVWGGIYLLDGEPHVVQRLSGLSTHQHRFHGEPLCDTCVDAQAVRLARRRERERDRARAKRAGAA